MSIENCPSDDQLERFNDGRLAEPEIDLISNHLDVCPADCLVRLQNMGQSQLEAGIRNAEIEPLPIASSSEIGAAVNDILKSISVDEYDRRTDQLGEHHYHLEELTNTTELAKIYSAIDYLGSPVTVHVSNSETLTTHEHLAQFLYDACDARLLHHPNIVPIFEIGAWNNQSCYYVTPRLQQTLRTYCEHQQPLDPVSAWEIIHQICMATANAHAKQVIHRHLDPDSIWILDNNHVLVSDFGLIFDGRYQFDLVQPNESPKKFQSPESAKNSTIKINPCSDVYSIGALVYWILKHSQQLSEPKNRLVKSIVAKSINPSRRMRYQSINEQRKALEQVLGQFDTENG